MPTQSLPPAQRQSLRQILEKKFSFDDLRIIVFDLGLDYDNLKEESKSITILKLIEEHERKSELHKLISICKLQRLDLTEWDEFEYLLKETDGLIDEGIDKFNKNEFDNALSLFSKKIEFDQNNLYARLWRGKSYISKEQFELAIDDLTLIKDRVNEAKILLGIAYARLGDKEEDIGARINHYDKSIEYDGTNTEVKIKFRCAIEEQALSKQDLRGTKEHYIRLLELESANKNWTEVKKILRWLRSNSQLETEQNEWAKKLLEIETEEKLARLFMEVQTGLSQDIIGSSKAEPEKFYREYLNLAKKTLMILEENLFYSRGGTTAINILYNVSKKMRDDQQRWREAQRFSPTRSRWSPPSYWQDIRCNDIKDKAPLYVKPETPISESLYQKESYRDRKKFWIIVDNTKFKSVVTFKDIARYLGSDVSRSRKPISQVITEWTNVPSSIQIDNLTCSDTTRIGNLVNKFINSIQISGQIKKIKPEAVVVIDRNGSPTGAVSCLDLLQVVKDRKIMNPNLTVKDLVASHRSLTNVNPNQKVIFDLNLDISELYGIMYQSDFPALVIEDQSGKFLGFLTAEDINRSHDSVRSENLSNEISINENLMTTKGEMPFLLSLNDKLTKVIDGFLTRPYLSVLPVIENRQCTNLVTESTILRMI